MNQEFVPERKLSDGELVNRKKGGSGPESGGKSEAGPSLLGRLRKAEGDYQCLSGRIETRFRGKGQ